MSSVRRVGLRMARDDRNSQSDRDANTNDRGNDDRRDAWNEQNENNKRGR